MDWATDKVGDRQKAPRLSDLADVLDLSDGKNHVVRPIGPAKRIARHWVTVKKEDGGKATFPKLCLGYNSDTGEVDGECPYCDIGLDYSVEVLQNVIDRDKEEEGPRKKNTKPTKSERKKQDLMGQEWRLIDGKDSTSWTPVKLHTFQASAGRKLGDIVELNKRKTKKGTKVFGPDHPKHGFDIAVKHDPKRQGAEKHGVQKADETELSEEQMEYLLWPLDLEKPEKLKQAKKEADGLVDRIVSRNDDDDDKKGKKKKKKPSDDDDDEDDDNSWGDDDSDDEDDEPKKSKKKDKGGKKKSKSRDDDDDDEDEDEDDEPKKKKKSKKSRDDDLDDDEEDEDEDDEPKKKGKKSSKKKSDDWDDEDDDDDEDSSVKKKGKKSKSRDDDEDDDEDDEPKKKKKSKDKSSGKKSKKSRDDDEDEDDDDDDWGDDDDDDDD